MQILQSLARHVGVNLGCRQVTVTEQHLHHTQIGTVIQQMSCERMAESVGRQMRLDVSPSGVQFNTIPERLASHCGAPVRGKKHIGRTRPH